MVTVAKASGPVVPLPFHAAGTATSIWVLWTHKQRQIPATHFPLGDEGPAGTRASRPFSQAFGTEVRKSGLPRIRLHNLRHTHAGIALRAGVPVKVIGERFGHEDPAFTMKPAAWKERIRFGALDMSPTYARSGGPGREGSKNSIPWIDASSASMPADPHFQYGATS